MNIKDLAKLAGVSPSIVSKIMNGKDDSISLETRTRVLTLAKEYNYYPYAGVCPAAVKTLLLGVIMPSSSLCGMTFQGILHAAQEQGYCTVICETADDGSDEYKRITALYHYRIDGVIWEPASVDNLSLAEEFKKQDILYVLINREDELEESISISYQNLGYKATQALIESRHTNIACLLRPFKGIVWKDFRRKHQRYCLLPLPYRPQSLRDGRHSALPDAL